MKKFLPAFLLSISFFAILFIFPHKVHADPVTIDKAPVTADDKWVIDPEVTFIGKNAARSGNLLNFTLLNYHWVCVKQLPSGQCDDSKNPIAAVWLTTVTYIVVPLLFVVILATAIIIIVTRGRSITVMRFLPRFVAVIILIFFSFALLQFFYQFVDVIQGFFLRSHSGACPPDCISNADLLYVGWKYQDFQGLRLLGDKNTESAFITLLLTKLTALTYFVMVGLLFLRKVILWLFIIVSPIFPLLLLYYPVRNTGKIWIGEFFRWLLYAPLFAIFLKGLVSLWRAGIPLVFTTVSHSDPNLIVYPTAVNILLGGPKEFVTLGNSINLTETFALYVVSLLMLWGVIILPWILLQIFLDYASNLGVGDSAVMKNMINMVNNRQGVPPSPSSHPPAGGGATINLPFTKKFSMPVPPSAPTGTAREIPVSSSKFSTTAFMPSAQVKAQVLTLTNMSLPTMRDIAKYDTSLISRDSSTKKEALTIRDNLIKIGNPESATSTSDKERYVEIREKLTQESTKGNTLATSILSAASTVSRRSSQASTSQIKSMLTQIANPQAASAAGATSVINREKLSKLNESLTKEKKEGNTLAASILSVNEKTSSAEIEKLQEKILDAKTKGEPVGVQLANALQKKEALPLANRVQTVSKEDYQAVKDMWKENYKNLEVPQGMAGTREEWVKDDIAKIDSIIGLLDSKDDEKIAQGMEEVSSILPFLLVGGFSQTEIISYLKAKQDAAKEVTVELTQEEEDKVSVSVKKTATAQQTMSATIPESSEDDTDGSDLSNASAKAGSKVIPNASVDILNMANLELPKLTDIVKYEMRHLTKDKTESERIEKMHGVLERIGNPASIQSEAERNQYETLREKLGEESLSGNATASTILSAVSRLTQTTSDIDATLVELKTILKQIANPQNLESSEDRDYYTRLHQYLENEIKQNSSTVSQSILSVNDTTKMSDIQNIKEQLSIGNNAGSPALPQLTSAVNDVSRARQLRSVISQILAPAEIKSQVDKKTYTTIKKSIDDASKKGDSLAASLLSINSKTPDIVLTQMHKKLVDAGNKGDETAKTILAQVSEPLALSSVSRLQEVKPEEYEEAKELWKKAYMQYFVPSGFTEDVKGRLEWINNDALDIEDTIGLLQSPDAEKKNTGLKKVSSILPFLLLGGFSTSEMIQYLQTKLDAAKEAITAINAEEDKSVQVAVKKDEKAEDKAMSEEVPDEEEKK